MSKSKKTNLHDLLSKITSKRTVYLKVSERQILINLITSKMLENDEKENKIEIGIKPSRSFPAFGLTRRKKSFFKSSMNIIELPGSKCPCCGKTL